jgi:hypothetical protein
MKSRSERAYVLAQYLLRQKSPPTRREAIERFPWLKDPDKTFAASVLVEMGLIIEDRANHGKPNRLERAKRDEDALRKAAEDHEAPLR